MRLTQLLGEFDRIIDAPDSIPRLRRFVLDLAVRGKLVEQDPRDESTTELIKRIHAEKLRLVKGGNVRKEKSAPSVAENEPVFPIPPNWQWSQLAEIGFINPRNKANDEVQASFVPMALISAQYGVPNTYEVRKWGEIKNGFTHFAVGDVALAKITPCFENGKSTVFSDLAGGIGAGTTELHIVRPVLVNPAYILIFLKCPHFIESGVPEMTGTAGQKRVSTEYFAHSLFPLPPLAEQTRIVAKVNELMSLCDRLESTQAERMRRRIRLTAASLHHLTNSADAEAFHTHARFYLDHLPRLTIQPEEIHGLRNTILNLGVGGKLTTRDPKDEPASILLTRLLREVSTYAREQNIARPSTEAIDDNDVPYPAPEGWIWTRLSSLFKVITDGDHQPPPRAERGVAFLTIGNITTGSLNFTNCRYVSESYLESIADYRKPSYGDILYTVVGATFGRPALVDTERPFCVQRHIAILKPTSQVETRFLLMLMGSPFVYEQAARSTTGTAQPTIPLRPLRNFLVPLPPSGEQRRIVAKVEELMAVCDRLEAQLSTVQDQRGALLGAVLSQALNDKDEQSDVIEVSSGYGSSKVGSRAGIAS